MEQKWDDDEPTLIQALIDIQKGLGFLPPEKLREVATSFGISEAYIWGVATFYNIFRFKPRGKTHIKVCMGTACHLSGGGLVAEAAERELNIKVGETTDDQDFSLERVACVGCCMLAPVVVINDRVYPRMSPLKLEEVLIEFKRDKKED
ncbi:MAG: NAD(P)H-dependent oxidoreductase subunit E [Deltaproteobacteria bacterium]|nr:NAD(P)H-dependent oxidoreductase subunit E [Deltaproteobacteria bacterium]